MITGLNHITLAVSQVDESLDFYVNILGFKPEVQWATGAYLSLDELWLCLSEDSPQPAKDYSHLAFSVEQVDFESMSNRILESGAPIWKDNKSEGDSLYFLDPNGHKLEIHVGDLQQRLEKLKTNPNQNLTWLNEISQDSYYKPGR